MFFKSCFTCHLNVPEIQIGSGWIGISIIDQVLNDCFARCVALALT